ncbi:DUF3995 domain-containing protein [Gracilibacillus kekensis]|uniref:DUF3995 domain-containing protein n=1 Tax=Gracilibacillus kekensis TaxID=1027249 RepID=A0A1M7JH42_9BACI|nr:DUF3995 domain-containing protein [Gracilibacillus kekensis]SHM52278.1 Protein of unknown function [Gracilibacillus kekensis]
MELILIYFTVLILVLISILHLYWVFGGKWGVKAVIPKKTAGGYTFTPKWFETLIVAIGLISMSFILLAQNNLVSFLPSNSFTKWSSILIAVIFFLRAIGDFKYFGITKKVKHTRFSNYDTKLYTPLCIYLGLIFMISWVY